nr:SdpI family protein [uncultured Aminipila sp.]
MAFWIFLVACNMLIPVIMIIFGKIFENKVPKRINNFYGYRTSMSRKNQDTWEFAHKCCGRLWKKVGLIMSVVTLILTVVSFTLSEDMQGIVCGIIVTIQTIVLIGSIFPVEKALKKNFDKNGYRNTEYSKNTVDREK